MRNKFKNFIKLCELRSLIEVFQNIFASENYGKYLISPTLANYMLLIILSNRMNEVTNLYQPLKSHEQVIEKFLNKIDSKTTCLEVANFLSEIYVIVDLCYQKIYKSI